jgi:tetratricopeptide (TPR) repeat protein
VAKGDVLYGPAGLQQANLLAALGRPQEAVAVLDGLIAAAPDDLDLLANAGDVLRNANQPAAAIGYYDRAIALVGNPPPPGTWVLFFDRGIGEDALGNWKAAQPDMLKALSLAPNQPYVLNYLGYSWAMHGEQLDKAQAMLKQAVGLAPNDGAVIDSLGYVTLREGDVKTAVALLTQAVELDPDNAEVNAHLGDAFWQAGRKLQANYQWQRALGLQPDAKLRAEITGKLQQHFGPPS